ncbi:protein translocase subunit SecD [bacterium]|nr:protein translocase subunit SecD [Chloroflexi bacterium CFX6]RIL10240.1 MAG: protein translocase subunit SecD [bacterium]
MKDRTPLMLGLIVVLTLGAIFANWSFVQPGYEHPGAVRSLLTWQSDDPSMRSLNLREGLDLQGGLQVLLQADTSKLKPGQAYGPAELAAAKSIIQNRVDALGVTEPHVRTQGEDKIVVELPGVADPDMAVRTIGETALLEFIYAGNQSLLPDTTVTTTYPVLFDELPPDKQKPFLGDPNAPIEGAPAAAGATGAVTTTAAVTTTGSVTTTAAGGAPPAKLQTLYPTVLTGAYVSNASVGFDPLQGVVVNFALSTEGGQRMQRYTSGHIDEIMAIALDKKIISAPSVRSTISANGQITGQFTQAEAESLVAQITSGSLPVPLKVVGQSRISPTLGGEAVSAAVTGGLIGLLAVVIFMVLYYRMPGFLATLALALYALLSLTIFRMFPVTLTLAGIAGFVLSIGMAVDANILIFERMKEELRAGRRISSAMEIGFGRAWLSIRDSNFSTLITCGILFWFGNQFGASVVKGFAVTLAIGVLVSLFTAITVTRSLLKIANRLVLHETDLSTLEDRRLRMLFGF